MRRAATLLLVLGLAGCASASPEGGVATYDALKQAQDNCAAKGKTLTLKSGGNTQWLEDYACKGN